MNRATDERYSDPNLPSDAHQADETARAATAGPGEMPANSMFSDTAIRAGYTTDFILSRALLLATKMILNPEGTAGEAIRRHQLCRYLVREAENELLESRYGFAPLEAITPPTKNPEDGYYPFAAALKKTRNQ